MNTPKDHFEECPIDQLPKNPDFNDIIRAREYIHFQLEKVREFMEYLVKNTNFHTSRDILKTLHKDGLFKDIPFSILLENTGEKMGIIIGEALDGFRFSSNFQPDDKKQNKVSFTHILDEIPLDSLKKINQFLAFCVQFREAQGEDSLNFFVDRIKNEFTKDKINKAIQIAKANQFVHKVIKEKTPSNVISFDQHRKKNKSDS